MQTKTTFQKIYAAVKLIPYGKVSTYGRIAKYLCLNNPRIVGYALHGNPDSSAIPCHRVVNAHGEVSTNFAFGGPDAQQLLLENEGIIFKKNSIDLAIYLYEY